MKDSISFNSLFILIFLSKINCLKADCFQGCHICDLPSTCEQCFPGECLKSGSSCITTSLECLTCTSSYKCSSCMNGYYLTNSKCLKCNSNCKTCSNSDKYCLSCKDGYYLDSHSCVECQSLCEKCYNATTCKSCKDNSFLYTGKCFQCNVNCKTKIDSCKCKTCDNGYYLSNYQCLKCDPNCKTCSVYSNLCSNCSDGYYLNNSSCLKCNSLCKTCNSEESCTSCNENYFLYNGKCIPCNLNCQSINSNCNCSVCNDGYYLFNYQCFQCDSNCKTCSNLVNNCSSCNSGYFLNNNSCIEYKDFLVKQLFNYTENTSFFNLEMQDNILEKIKEIFSNKFDTNIIDDGEDLILSFLPVNYTVTTTSNQKNNENNNKTIINLGECESKLKEKYNISKNESLYILKVDILINNIHKIEYNVYYSFNTNNLTQLNLSLCKDIKINISIPINISTKDLDKYNKSSGLYNDICYTLLSESGTDKNLKDRQNDFINNNLSICEEDCEFSDYDIDTKRAICSCPIKMKLPLISEIKFDKEKLLSNFKNIKNIGNFKMLKCNHLLFNKNNLFKNSANFMVIILGILSFISLFIFVFYNNKNIKIIINKFVSNEKTYMKNKNKETENNNKQKIKKVINNNTKSSKRFKDKNELKENILKIKDNNKQKQKRVKNGEILSLNLNPINKNFNINNENESFAKTLLKSKRNKKEKNKNRINDITKNSKIKETKIEKQKTCENKENPKNKGSFNDIEMNSLDYEEAKKLDNRVFVQYYI